MRTIKNTLRALVTAAALYLPGAAGAALLGDSPEFSDDDLRLWADLELDYTPQHEDILRWDLQSWYGGDYSKLWLLLEGEREDGEVEDAELQLLYGRYLSEFWDWRAGLRHDFEPDALGYLVLGVHGLAPHWLETEASLYLSEDGDLSAEMENELELLLTQRLLLQPYLDLELFAQDVAERGKGAGLTQTTLGLQLRYELRREIAPYVDIGYTRRFGRTADFARASGQDVEDTVLRVGLKVWY